MRVVEKPEQVIRIRVDAIVKGKEVRGAVKSLHLTDTTLDEVFGKIVKALGIPEERKADPE